MAQFENGNFDYADDDYFDITAYNEDPFEETQSENVDWDTDDDDADMNKQKTDTSAFEARDGKDIQGIPWERFNFSRDKYREMRLKQYKNYENLSGSSEHLEKECKVVKKGSTFYDFQFNTRLVKSTIVHFQILWHIEAALFISTCLYLVSEVGNHKKE